MSGWSVGDVVPLEYRVLVDDVLTDATVAVTITDPAGATSAPAVTHADTGIYTADVAASAAGVWYYSWTASGAATDRSDGQYSVAALTPPTYVTIAAVKSAIGLPIEDVEDDATMALALDAVCRDIEEWCHRPWPGSFALERSASARTYSSRHRLLCLPDGHEWRTDEIGSLDGLVVELGSGTSWTAYTDYDTSPDNALLRGKPVEALTRTSWPVSSTTRLRVTARWGWPRIPEQVTQACLLLATETFKLAREAPFGVAGFGDFGVVRVRDNVPAQRLLAPLRRDPVMVA